MPELEPTLQEPAAVGTHAPPDVADDKFEIMRRQNAISQKIATSFVRSGMLEPVFLLRMTLAGEVKLMHRIVGLLGRTWEEEQFVSLLEGGPREYRFHRFHQGEDFKLFLHEAHDVFTSTTLWGLCNETEEFRSDLFKKTFRPAAVIWQLVILRTAGFPYQLFRLLANERPEVLDAVAQKILHETPPCMFDSWTREFLKIYDSVDKLRGMKPSICSVLSQVARMEAHTQLRDCTAAILGEQSRD